MITDFSVDAFLRAADAAVAEKGVNYVQERCIYRLADGTPVCFIANILTRLGGDLRREYEGMVASSVMHRLGYTNPALMQAASEAQMTADVHKTWGEARDKLKSSLGCVGY